MRALVLALVVFATAGRALAQTPIPSSSGYAIEPAPVVVDAVQADAARPRPRPLRLPLLISGGAVFAGAWAVDGIVSLFAGEELGLGPAPPLGPPPPPDGVDWDLFRGCAWIPLAGPWIQIGVHSTTPGWTGFLVADGILQLAGFTLLLVGAALDEPPRVAVVPHVDRESARLTLAGRF